MPASAVAREFNGEGMESALKWRVKEIHTDLAGVRNDRLRGQNVWQEERGGEYLISSKEFPMIK